MDLTLPSLENYRERCTRKARRWSFAPRITESLPQFKVRFSYSAEEHVALAKRAMDHYADTKIQWAKSHKEALEKWGECHPLISGYGYAGNAPEWMKNHLRNLALDSTTWADASITHWRAAGKLTVTWRRLFNQMKEKLYV